MPPEMAKQQTSEWATAVASKFDANDCGSFVNDWEMYNLDSENVSWEVIISEFDIPTEYQALPYAYAMCKASLELDAWLRGYDVEDGVYDPCAMTAVQVEVDGENRLWAAHNCDSWDLILSLFFEGTIYSDTSNRTISSDADFKGCTNTESGEECKFKIGQNNRKMAIALPDSNDALKRWDFTPSMIR